MSSSTGAAAAAATPTADNNPFSTLASSSQPTARRRAVVVVGKTSNGHAPGEGAGKGVVEDKMVVNGRDLSHTIRGESVVGRPKELLQLKKGLISSPAAPHRHKKPALKPEKPRWQTILNIALKNCILIAVLVWLGQTIWAWNSRVQNGPDASFEGRISDLKAVLKETAKMLQAQLDEVDKKIGSEIGRARTGMRGQIEEKIALLERDLNKLESRTDGLDKSLAELKSMDFLSKKELESVWNDLKASASSGEHESDKSLDQIRDLARKIVEKEIEKHAADGLGRVDYAVASGGARVIRHSEPYSFGKISDWLSAAKGRGGVHANAQKMLEPSFGEPGQCFPLQGSSGFVEIRLRTGIIPEAVTLEHVSKSVAYDRSSAPKDCRVSGWSEAPEDDPSTRAAKMVLLTDFSYNLEKGNAQTFDINAVEPRVVNMVRLDFNTNHGSSALTCIYRFRVHGHEPSSP